MRNHHIGRASRHNFPAKAPRAGAHINQIIGGAHGVFVVFHHQNGVAQIPQIAQGFQQTVIIPLMQPNGGFIQNIQNPAQPASDLGCQANPLILPP